MENKFLKHGKIIIDGNEVDMSKGIPEMRIIPDEVVKLFNLSKHILGLAKIGKERVIGYDKETFEELKGKEIKLTLSNEVLEMMEEDVKRIAKEWGDLKC
ncbi:hypothetical protein NH288_08455 [Anaerococcus sp. NML200537]|uniref:hypothetical protein n=1 Tax=Anaerococcus sp. NML200537 TaxID=2954485 RepID=UPI002238A8C5|nr:hypothetical protein [Anaerococcus sp. NML200537]MCW6702118.1 hypothetical protein [Anaerococcus sp. NML200537]